MKDLPFSFYEIFAVFIPGFIFINTLWMFTFSSLTYVSAPGGLVAGSYILAISYIVGQAISHLSKFLLEDSRLKSSSIGECSVYMIRQRTPHIVLKYVFIEHTKPLRPEHADRFLALIGNPPAHEIKDIIFGTIFHLTQTDTTIKKTLEYWQRLYHGFRNLCLTFLLLTFYSVYKFIEGHALGLPAAIVFMPLSIIMFYRYLLFSKYYCRDLIMWFRNRNIALER